MPNSSLRIQLFTGVFFACLCIASGGATHAQSPPATIATDAAIDDAIDAAASGQSVDVARFRRHPLSGWLEYAGLRRNIDSVSAARAQSFMQRHEGQAVADSFRALWLAEASRREDWPAYLDAWSAGIDDVALRCGHLNARHATGAADAQWIEDAQAIWGSSGRSLPDNCDPVFAALAARGGLPPELRWTRLELAAAEWQPGVMRAAARGLPAEQFALASDYAAFIDDVHERALDWPKTPRSRLIASHGLARLGRSSPDAAEAALPRFAAALDFSEADRGRVLYQIALWTVASYYPQSERRLAAVPASAYDERLHEWRVRDALSRSDWSAALAAIELMDEEQRSDSRWTYFAARTSELTGDKAGAQALYRAAARIPEFHGFLAADRLEQPYALCPRLPQHSADARAAVARDPALLRAMALFRIDRIGWAVREWKDALSRFDDDQRYIAVEIAQDNGWFDRGLFGLIGRNPEDRRLYELRFPLHHDDIIRREAARHDLDPAWIAAEIRAESVFNPKARSSANARGLMQVLPSTGAAVARRHGIDYAGAESLYDPETNIAIGSAYLREMEDKYDQTYAAIAAYNAGPSPVARWQSQRPAMDPDFWIETISYRETREYVARVLAFSVIYDWRLDGDAQRVSDRMRGIESGQRKGFSCPSAQPEA